MFKLRKFIFLIITQIFIGCSSVQHSSDFNAEKPKNGMALLYVYQPSYLGGKPHLYVNGKYIGELLQGGYYSLNVKPGPVEVYFRSSFLGFKTWKEWTFNFEAKENTTYYAEAVYRVIPYYYLRFFGLVPEEKGLKNISSTQLLVPKE